VRVGEAAAAKIRHWIRLAPDHVIQDPETEVLKDGAHAENIVIGADDPERRGRLHHALAGLEPGLSEGVVFAERVELVPVVVHSVDPGIVGTLQIALQLQIIRRIGEDEIDAFRRQRRHLRDAIAHKDAGALIALESQTGRPMGRPATRLYHDSEL
jgi:hypothetical protein